MFLIKFNELLGGVLTRVFLGVSDAVLRKAAKFFGVGKKVGNSAASFLMAG